jgi:hypothetical protein
VSGVPTFWLAGAANVMICGVVKLVQVRVVIENGGKLNVADGLKLERVLETGTTTAEFSFVSVMLAEVSCCICTVPLGKYSPPNVTGRLAERWVLMMISE